VAVLYEAQGNPEFKASLWSLLGRFLIHIDERELFGFEPLPPKPELVVIGPPQTDMKRQSGKIQRSSWLLKASQPNVLGMKLAQRREKQRTDACPPWLHTALQGITFWMGHRRCFYRNHPLTEGALVAEICALVYANMPEEYQLFAKFSIRISSRSRFARVG
jgi:hypothetical protein